MRRMRETILIWRQVSALAFVLLLAACGGTAPSDQRYPEGLEPRNSVPYMRP